MFAEEDISSIKGFKDERAVWKSGMEVRRQGWDGWGTECAIIGQNPTNYCRQLQRQIINQIIGK